MPSATFKTKDIFNTICLELKGALGAKCGVHWAISIMFYLSGGRWGLILVGEERRGGGFDFHNFISQMNLFDTPILGRRFI